jgi:hypothetical protein
VVRDDRRAFHRQRDLGFDKERVRMIWKNERAAARSAMCRQRRRGSASTTGQSRTARTAKANHQWRA